MNAKLTNLWNQLEKLKIKKIVRITPIRAELNLTCVEFSNNSTGEINEYLEDYSRDDLEYYNVYIGINKAMVLYELLLNFPESNSLEIKLKYRVLSEQIIVILITCLELYLKNTFQEITNDLTKYMNKEEQLFKILRARNEIKNNKTNLIQNYERLKELYILLNVNIPEIVTNEIWQRCLSKEPFGNPKRLSYMRYRHKIIHSSSILLNNLNQVIFEPELLKSQYFEEAIIEITTFIYKLNNELKTRNLKVI